MDSTLITVLGVVIGVLLGALIVNLTWWFRQGKRGEQALYRFDAGEGISHSGSASVSMLRSRVDSLALRVQRLEQRSEALSDRDAQPGGEGPAARQELPRLHQERAPFLDAQRSRDHVAVAHQFLKEREGSFFDVEGASRWFQSQLPGSRVELLTGEEQQSWALLRLIVGNDALVIPAMARPMGDCALGDYFELRNYNGINPLSARSIAKFPRQVRQGMEWKTQEQGLIDGT